MADAGGSRDAPDSQDAEYAKRMFETFMHFVESNYGAPQKDKKQTFKRKKEPNKKMEALKKKAAEEKARILKTKKEMMALKLLEQRERASKRFEARKLLMERDAKIIEKVNEKLGQSTEQ